MHNSRVWLLIQIKRSNVLGWYIPTIQIHNSFQLQGITNQFLQRSSKGNSSTASFNPADEAYWDKFISWEIQIRKQHTLTWACISRILEDVDQGYSLTTRCPWSSCSATSAPNLPWPAAPLPKCGIKKPPQHRENLPFTRPETNIGSRCLQKDFKVRERTAKGVAAYLAKWSCPCPP